ncbi:MAG: OmpH family outer membrane protein [Planctomycetota bacterium]|jgi:Skp family chaperone for outer membrane proteins
MVFKKTGSLFIIAGLIPAFCLMSALGGGQDSKDAVKKNIAYLDFSKAVTSHKGFQKVYKEWEETLKEAELKFSKVEEEVKQIETEIMVYSESSKEYQKARDKMERKQLFMQQEKRALYIDRSLQLNQELRKAYDRVMEKVNEYALTRDLDAVLSLTHDVKDLKPDQPDDFMKWIAAIDVVWYEKDLDITEAIIDLVNST